MTNYFNLNKKNTPKATRFSLYLSLGEGGKKKEKGRSETSFQDLILFLNKPKQTITYGLLST